MCEWLKAKLGWTKNLASCSEIKKTFREHFANTNRTRGWWMVRRGRQRCPECHGIPGRASNSIRENELEWVDF